MPPRRLARGLVSTAVAALLPILCVSLGCSGGETAVAPTATVGQPPESPPSKTAAPRPGSQNPGSAEYADKPGGRGRGR